MDMESVASFIVAITLFFLFGCIIPNLYIAFIIFFMAITSLFVFAESNKLFFVFTTGILLFFVFLFWLLLIDRDRHNNNSLWKEMNYQYHIYQQYSRSSMERFFYRLFPTFNNIACCWNEYLLIKASLPEYKDLFNQIQQDIFTMLHNKEKLHGELYDLHHSYRDVIFIITSNILETLILEHDSLDRLSRLFQTSNKAHKLFKMCIDELHKSGAFSDEKYKQDIDWLYHH